MKTWRLLLALLLALWGAAAHAASSYTFRSDSFAWETAANTITWDRACTSYPGDDDKATITFTGAFKFRFAGTDYTSVRVLSNGGLQFGSDTGFFRTYTNTALPAGTPATQSGCTSAATTNVILAYWTDLNPSQSGSGGVTWEQKGASPNRYVVVSWNGVYQYNTSTPYTFQIILYESASGVNGEFKYQYGNANASGSNATIGVQVSSTDTTQYSYNSGYNANGSAIRWFVPNGTPTRRAEYRFDEYSYSGRVGEVLDSTTNSNNGVRVGTATTVAAGYVCRGLSIPANTTSASHAVDTLLDVNSGIGDKGAVTFWYAANTAWNNSAAMLLDATTATNRPFFLVRQSDGSLRATISDGNGTLLSAATTAQAVSAGTWKHIAISWRLATGTGQSSLRIYINGLQAGAATTTTTGSLDNSIGTLFVGDNRNTTAPTNGTLNSANGTLDEMRVYNYDISALELTADMAPTHACPPPLDHVEAVPAASTGSTCAPITVTVRACSDAACNTVMTGYTGTVNLSTSSNRGDWTVGSGPTPLGVLTPGTAGSGNASYRFVATDFGVARLQLSHSLAQSVRITAVDSLTPGTTTTSSAVQFNDNALVWSIDPSNKIYDSSVVVAGRNHALQVSLIKRTSSSSCGIATDFNGTRNVKLWRTNNGGAWTAPTIVSPALTIPASRPATNNLALPFTAGVASLTLATTDIGKYTLNLDDDSLAYASTTLSGSIGDLTVRPFVIVVNGIAMSGLANPGGSNPADTFFGKAGTNFSATVAAYRWASGVDGIVNGSNPVQASSDGLLDPDPTNLQTLAQVTSGGLVPGFNSATTLKMDAASQTPPPPAGVPGVLSNNVISSFTGGSATVANLNYNEVGSFLLDTVGVVTNYLGNGAMSLDAVVFNSIGAKQTNGIPATRVGRFIPAGFTVAGFAATHRSDFTCAPASNFTYLDENFGLTFTLTARNAAGETTRNYVGGFAKLDPAAAASYNLAGIAGTTPLKGAARLATSFVTPVGTQRLWVAGVASTSSGSAAQANVTLTAKVLRGAAPEGPFNTAQFGIAPVDSDGVAMLALNLDTDSPTNVADSALLGQIPLRYGRLRLQNGMSAADRPLALSLTAQYWDSSTNNFKINDLDSCTRVTAANLSFGNFRRTLESADAVMTPNEVTVNPAGNTFITFAKPRVGRVGSMDVAIALGAGANPSDASCMPAGWRTNAATTGANLVGLRGAWCNGTSDPSARATWGLYRGSNGIVYQRENF